MAKIKVWIDRDECISDMVCVSLCGEVFEINEEDGKSQIVEQYRIDPNNLAEIQDWFRHGKSDVHLGDFERVLRAIVPQVEFLSFQTKRCILTRTANKYPIIDQIPRLNIGGRS
jgi:ferredoxin